MTRKIRNTLIAILLLGGLISAGSASAQRQMPTPQQRVDRLKDSLALADTQVTAILKIYQEADQARKKMFESSNTDDRDARMAAMRSLSEKTDTQIEALLSDTQKAKYEEMKKQRVQGFGGRRRGRE